MDGNSLIGSWWLLILTIGLEAMRKDEVIYLEGKTTSCKALVSGETFACFQVVGGVISKELWGISVISRVFKGMWAFRLLKCVPLCVSNTGFYS